MRGQAIALDRVTLRAGIAALEGRRPDAIAGYRESLRGWRALGLAFDEAMAALDMAILLAQTERETAEASTAIDAPRETLARLKAEPFLARLDKRTSSQQARSRQHRRRRPVRRLIDHDRTGG